MKYVCLMTAIGVLCAPLRADEPAESLHAEIQRIMTLKTAAQQALEAKKYEEAAKNYGEGIEVQAQLLWKNLDNLATSYTDQGKHAEAEPILRELLAVRIAGFGDDSPESREIKMRLATGIALRLLKQASASADEVASLIQASRDLLDASVRSVGASAEEAVAAQWQLTLACSVVALNLSRQPEAATSERQATVEIARRGFEIYPENGILCVVLVWLQCQQGEFSPAAESLARLPHGDWRDPTSEYFLRALVNAKLGNRQLAEDFFVAGRERLIKSLLLPGTNDYLVFPKRLQTMAAQQLNVSDDLPIDTWESQRLVATFSRLTDSQPEDVDLRRRYANQLARDGRWKEAAESYRIGLDQKRDELERWTEVISMLGQAGESDQCKRLRHEAYEQFKTTDVANLRIAISRLVSLYPSDDVDYDRLYGMLEVILAEKYEEWPYFVKGFLAYRCGRFEEAIDTLKANNAPEAQLFRAMALFKLGKTDLAREEFNRASQAAHNMDPRVPFVSPWEDAPTVYCWVQTMAREAATLMSLPYPPTPPATPPAQ